MSDHYEALGVPRDATADDIKTAFRRCASKAHPDRAGGSVERMAAVNRAYGVLGDSDRRERYDSTGEDNFLDIDKAAADVLATLFEASLNAQVDPLDHAHAMLREAKAKTASRSAELASALSHLKKQRGRIKVKSGENILESIIARRIQTVEREQGQMLDSNKVHARIGELLAQYEGPPRSSVVELPHGLNPGQVLWGSQMQNPFAWGPR